MPMNPQHELSDRPQSTGDECPACGGDLSITCPHCVGTGKRSVHDQIFTLKLGMHEIELTLLRLIVVNMEQRRTTFSVEDCKSEQERIGFVEMIYRELLGKSANPYHYNGTFSMTDRLRDKLPADCPLKGVPS